MAQIVDLQEFRATRRHGKDRLERAHLERAVELLRINLVAAALQLRDAEPADQEERLRQVERLSALLRYGLRMLGADYGTDSSDFSGS